MSERAIGEIVEFNGGKFKAVKPKNPMSCIGCDVFDLFSKNCSVLKCMSYGKDEMDSVIFKEVDEFGCKDI